MARRNQGGGREPGPASKLRPDKRYNARAVPVLQPCSFPRVAVVSAGLTFELPVKISDIIAASGLGKAADAQQTGW